MSKKIITILVISGCSILGLLILIGIFAPKKTDWENNEFNSKDPFGYYILQKELKQITNANSVNILSSLDEINSYNSKDIVIIRLQNNFDYQRELEDKMKLFLDNGGTILRISPENKYLKKERLSAKENEIILQNDLINNSNFNSNKNKYTNNANGFINKRNLPITILSQVTNENDTLISFYKEKKGRGTLYQHSEPKLFSNFYLLEPDGYQNLKNILKPFTGKDILILDPNKDYIQPEENSTSALSFVLSQPELRTAWYILLISIFLFLIFKSKREQKIIPIIKPEQNLSLEFANVIASMYYESGKPNDIIKKQIDYFFYSLRKQFNVITEDIFDKHFIYILSQKAQITEEETLSIITELNTLYNKHKSSLKDVEKTYQLINNYKKKAQIA